MENMTKEKALVAVVTVFKQVVEEGATGLVRDMIMITLLQPFLTRCYKATTINHSIVPQQHGLSAVCPFLSLFKPIGL